MGQVRQQCVIAHKSCQPCIGWVVVKVGRKAVIHQSMLAHDGNPLEYAKNSAFFQLCLEKCPVIDPGGGQPRRYLLRLSMMLEKFTLNCNTH